MNRSSVLAVVVAFLGIPAHAGDGPAGDKARGIAAQIQEIAAASLGVQSKALEAAAPPKPVAPTAEPKIARPPFGVAAAGDSDVDYPWTMQMGETAFEEAKANPLDEGKLLGIWELVARANFGVGFYNPKNVGPTLEFSAVENPLNHNKRESAVVVADPDPYVFTVSFQVRSPSVFFKTPEREVRGRSYWVHYYKDDFECRLVDAEHLICRRATTGTSDYVSWEGFVRLKQ